MPRRASNCVCSGLVWCLFRYCQRVLC